jgi:hypothetical protein
MKLATYCDGKIVQYGYSDTTRYCFVGLETDAQLCKMLFWDINNRIRSIFNKMKKAMQLKDRNAFSLGVVLSLCNRMIEAKKVMLQTQITERGLITIDHKNNEFAEYYSNLSKGFVNSNHRFNQERDWDSFKVGTKVGNDMEMSVVNPTV